MPIFCGPRQLTAVEIRVDARFGSVFSYAMELRKDPITRSWVITGDDPSDGNPRQRGACPFCPDSPNAAQIISTQMGSQGTPWAARAVVHPTPLYRIEADPGSRAHRLYHRIPSLLPHKRPTEIPT